MKAKRLTMLMVTSMLGISAKAPRKLIGIPMPVQKASRMSRKSARMTSTNNSPSRAFRSSRSMRASSILLSSSHMARFRSAGRSARRSCMAPSTAALTMVGVSSPTRYAMICTAG